MRQKKFRFPRPRISLLSYTPTNPCGIRGEAPVADRADAGPEEITTRILTEAIRFGIIAVILGVLYAISTYNYLLFHGIAEIAAIAVAFAIFLIVWNTRRASPDTFFLIVGISFLFTGTIDLVHMLAYKGMGVFPGDDANLPTQLWIAARYFQSITFLIATFFIGRTITRERKYDAAIIVSACAAASALLVLSIVAWQNFPACFIEGSGLTPFKVYSEYVISLILIAAIFILYRNRGHFDPGVWRYLVAAQVFLIAGELAFTSYVSVYGFMNMLGHLFRFVSAYLFYRAFVVHLLQEPHERLRSALMTITASEEELRANYDELARTEDALRESEQKFRETVQMLDDGYFSCELDGKILAHNAAFNRILGIDPGRDMKGFMMPDFWQDPGERPAYVKELSENGFVRNYSVAAKTIDGTPRQILVSAHLVRDDATRIKRIDGIFTDITGYRLAEQALLEEQEFNRILLDAFPVYYVAISQDGRTLAMNHALLDALEYTEDEVRGKEYLSSFVPAEDRRHLQEVVFPEIMDEGRGNVNINRIVSKSGRVFTVEWHGRPVRREAGKPGFFVGAGIDISDRIRAEEALRESEARYLALTEDQTELVFRLTPGRKCTFANPAFLAFFGQEAKETTGFLFALPVYAEDTARMQQHLAALSREHPVAGITCRVVVPDGTVRTLHWTTRAFFHADGTVAEYQFTGHET